MATMRKFIIISVVFIVSLSCFSVSYAQMTGTEKSNWLLGVISELEKMRDEATAKIKVCDNTIAKSENIIMLARKRGNTPAEQIVKEALETAMEAKNKNENIKKMIENNIAILKKVLAKPSNENLSKEEQERAKARIAEIKKDILKIQELLKECIESNRLSIPARESWEQKINKSYNESWNMLKKDLFYEIGTEGLGIIFKKRTKDIEKETERAWEIMRETTDRNRKSQLLGYIEYSQREKELLEYNKMLLQRLRELKSSYDVYMWDSKDAPFPEKFADAMDLMGGLINEHYGLAKIDVVASVDVGTEITAWYKINKIDKQNEQCSSEVKSLSYRMETKVQEMNCLNACVDNPSSGCVDKCRGKTKLSTSPPLLE